MHKGSYPCGAVRFQVNVDLPPPDACPPDADYCSKCRKHSGNYFASIDVLKNKIEIDGSETISWYRSSER